MRAEATQQTKVSKNKNKIQRMPKADWRRVGVGRERERVTGGENP